MERKTTLGLIIGNRGFFPDHLCKEGRSVMMRVLKEEGFNVVTLNAKDTKFGSVESLDDSKKCAELFKANSEKIDGILVSLPNFGDEAGVANSIRMADLDVPVLIQAFPDEADKMTIDDRRDSFCGKMSVCNNLDQYGIRYSLTTLHTSHPESDSFRQDLRDFGACCRVVAKLRNARIGAIGARPAAFKTVRYSEKLLEASGISVEVIDLFDLFGRVDKLSDSAGPVKTKLNNIKSYIATTGVPDEAIVKMAKFGVVVDEWIKENELDATAVQCWTAIEEFFGVVPCTIMSMLSDSLLPSACEVDITGAIGMLAMRCASGAPSALLDWNNNYGEDPDSCVLFHCSNLPKSMFSKVKMDYQEIIAGTVGKENTYGTCVGPLQTGPFTYTRISTDDVCGTVRGYIGEGKIVKKPIKTFGGHAVANIEDLQGLLYHICSNGFEHHVAINRSQVATAVYEALTNYMDWDMYYHAPGA